MQQHAVEVEQRPPPTGTDRGYKFWGTVNVGWLVLNAGHNFTLFCLVLYDVHIPLGNHCSHAFTSMMTPTSISAVPIIRGKT